MKVGCRDWTDWWVDTRKEGTGDAGEGTRGQIKRLMSWTHLTPDFPNLLFKVFIYYSKFNTRQDSSF